MVNSKKMNKSTVAVVVLALLLVLSLILSATGAWFTDKETGSEITKDFGVVNMKVTATDFGKVTRVSNDEGPLALDGKIMPGDTIGYSLTVEKAEGSEEFWFAVLVTVSGLKEDITTEISAAIVKDSAVDDLVEGSVVLTGADYGNTYQGAQITLSYEVVAVQKANVADKAAAAALLGAAEAYTPAPKV